MRLSRGVGDGDGDGDGDGFSLARTLLATATATPTPRRMMRGPLSFMVRLYFPRSLAMRARSPAPGADLALEEPLGGFLGEPPILPREATGALLARA